MSTDMYTIFIWIKTINQFRDTCNSHTYFFRRPTSKHRITSKLSVILSFVLSGVGLIERKKSYNEG